MLSRLIALRFAGPLCLISSYINITCISLLSVSTRIADSSDVCWTHWLRLCLLDAPASQQPVQLRAASQRPDSLRVFECGRSCSRRRSRCSRACSSRTRRSSYSSSNCSRFQKCVLMHYEFMTHSQIIIYSIRL